MASEWDDFPIAPRAAQQGAGEWDAFPQAQAAQPAYSGAILPVSRDAEGNPYFDINAGITGSLIRAFRAPGDALTGRMQVIGDDGRTTPEANARAAEMAALISPANPAMRAGDRAIPGVARKAMVPEKLKPPTATALKESAGKGYDAARASGLEIRGDAVAEMALGLQQSLQSERGIIAKTAPKTFAILDELSNPPRGGVATIPGIEAARRGLSDISREGGTEGMAAGNAVRHIDSFLSSLADNSLAAPPSGAVSAAGVADTLRAARANYAAAQRSNDLTGTLDRAVTGISERAENRAQAANSGRNLDNAIRQRIASLLEKPKEIAGYSDAELEAMRRVLQGGPVRNTSRYVGNLLGGGGGLGQAVTAGIGAAGGAAAAGGPGAALGAAAPAVTGAAAKSLSNALAKRSLRKADETVRMNSPLYRELLAQQPTYAQGLQRDELIARLLGVMAPPEQGDAWQAPDWLLLGR